VNEIYVNWINVTEQLPEDGVKKLVKYDNGAETQARYFSETGNWTLYDKPYYRNGKPAAMSFSLFKDANAVAWAEIPPLPPPKPDLRTATLVVRKPHEFPTTKNDAYRPQCEAALDRCGCWIGRRIKFIYCPYCTQKLKWED